MNDTKIGKGEIKRYTGEFSRDKILKQLRVEGVDTLPKLVDEMLSFNESPLSKRQYAPVSALSVLASENTKVPALKKIKYEPPHVPLYIDGVSTDPNDISQFDGHELHFILSKSKLSKKGDLVLHAFTSPYHLNFLKGLKTASLLGMKSQQSPQYEDRGTFYPCSLGYHGSVQMFLDIDYGGDWLWLPAGYAWPDLTQVCLSTFMWWCTDSWNDKISSMAATDTTVTYYWDTNYNGPSLTVIPYECVYDLTQLGWNDVISSVVNWGY
jgi:hypothetical protein